MAVNTGIVEIPPTVKDYLRFNETFFAKHDAMGPDSPLLQLKNVDWEAVQLQADGFSDQYTIAETCTRLSCQATEMRNNQGVYLTKFVSAAKSLLKSYYAQNLRLMTDWGFTVNIDKRGIIYFPPSGNDFVTFISELMKKHEELGADSPLKNLPDVDWVKIKAAIVIYKDKNTEMEDYIMQAKQANTAKDSLRAQLIEVQILAKNYLKSLNKDNIRQLESWGFWVTSYNKAKSEAATAKRAKLRGQD